MSFDAHKRYNSDMETTELDAPVQTHAPSHLGRQFHGCDCDHCEDTRDRLRVSMAAMQMFGPEKARVVRCAWCEHWIIDGDPTNGRIGTAYGCEDCYHNQEAVAHGRMAELAADTRRGK